MKTFRIVILVASVLVAGCARQNGVNITDAQMGQFTDGSTTADQVIASLGRPLSDVRDSSGLRVIGYSFMSTQVNGATFVPVVGMFAGGASGQTRLVTFQFDGNSVLVKHTVMTSQFGG